jgi:hypothetical protein
MACRGSIWCELDHGQGPRQELCSRSVAQSGFLLYTKLTDPIVAGIGWELVPLVVLSCIMNSLAMPLMTRAADWYHNMLSCSWNKRNA